MKETLKEAGYIYIRYLGDGEHLLRHKDNGNEEVWFSNKNHASSGLIYKNTHLEFARQQKSIWKRFPDRTEKTMKQFRKIHLYSYNGQGNNGLDKWKYQATTTRYRTVAEAVAYITQRHPQHQWRGERGE